MSRIFAIALLLTAACALQAQETASLELTAQFNGKPWANQDLVLIWVPEELESADRRSWNAKSDENGVARFSNVIENTWDFWVMPKFEHVEWERNQRPVPRALQLKAGPNSATVEFSVANCAWLEVALPEDKPAAAMSVSLKPLTVGALGRYYSNTWEGSRLVCGYVPAGGWLLEIRYADRDGALGRTMPFVREFDVVAGPLQLLNIALVKRKFAGSVKLPSDSITESCTLSMRPAHFAWWHVAPADYELTTKDEKFDFGELPEGDYVLVVKNVGKKVWHWAYADVSLTEDNTKFKVSFPSKAGDLVVKLQLPRESAEAPHLRILDEAGTTPVPVFGEYDTKLGAVVFHQMPEGTYVVEATGAGWATVTEKAKVKDGKQCTCEIKGPAGTRIKIYPEYDDVKPPMGRLTWFFEDAEGKPIPLNVSTELTGEARSSEGEEFFLPFLPGNAVSIHFTMAGYEEQVLSVDVKSGKGTNLALPLKWKLK
jgi:hypothetical protein